ncbi:unnamed protein product, partial [marine sediment metagenome]
MSEKGADVVISPENVEVLQEELNLDAAGVQKVLDKAEIRAPIQTRALPAKLEKAPNEQTGQNELMKKLSSGDLTMAEVVMYEGMQIRRDKEDRRERREEAREKRENNGNPTLTEAGIGRQVGGQLFGLMKEAGYIGNGDKTPEEKSDIEIKMDEILKRMKGDEKKKERAAEDKQLIAPLVNRLDKQAEKM